jgi:hypothetical protein
MEAQTTVKPPRPDLDLSHQSLQPQPGSLPAVAGQNGPAVAAHAAAPAVRSRPAPNEYAKCKDLLGAVAQVIAGMATVEKAGWNDFHKYTYPRIEDVMAQLSPLLGQHGIVVFQTEVSRNFLDTSGTEKSILAVTYEFTITHKSGQVWPDRPQVTGAARAKDSRGGLDDKVINKCHTAARKFFNLSQFQIKVEDVDDEDGPKPPRPEAKPEPVLQSGEPHPIPTAGLQYRTWVALFEKAISASKSIEEIALWQRANAGALNQIGKDKPEISARLMQTISSRMTTLATGTLRSDDPPQSAEEFLTMVEAELSAVENPDDLETVWNDKIAGLLGDQLAPDQQEAEKIKANHEKRLGID